MSKYLYFIITLSFLGQAYAVDSVVSLNNSTHQAPGMISGQRAAT